MAEIGGESQVGFHGHENLSLSLANTVLAMRAGAVQVDGSTRRFGAGAGNTSVEAMAAVFERLGIRTGIDVLQIIDAAEDVVRPLMEEECALDRMSLIMGYAGVYSSFLKHAYRAADRYGVSGAEILLECGRQRLVGGQEDQIIQIAAQLATLRWVVPPARPTDHDVVKDLQDPGRRRFLGRREGNRPLCGRGRQAGWRSPDAARVSWRRSPTCPRPRWWRSRRHARPRRLRTDRRRRQWQGSAGSTSSSIPRPTCASSTLRRQRRRTGESRGRPTSWPLL